MKNSILVLVDASFYFYRSYYVFSHFFNKLGEPTGAIYGVLSMVRSILLKYSPVYMAMVFDSKGKTFRNFLFKDYKSNRVHMPQNLCKQISPLFKIITAMGMPLIVADNVEADDVIGTLALSASNDGVKVLIISGDKDMMQLVSSNIHLIHKISDIVIDRDFVYRKFGVVPKLIVDYLALTGDSTDNIPGVPGIGPKRALILLQKLGSLCELYSNLDKVGSLGFKGAKNVELILEHYKDIAFLSYKLATIKTDVVLNREYYQLLFQDSNIDELFSLLQRYELQFSLKELFVLLKKNI